MDLKDGLTQKGADILVCHVPSWGLPEFNEHNIRKRLNDVHLPGILSWSEDGPCWSIQSTSVCQIVIIKQKGCVVIQVVNSPKADSLKENNGVSVF